MFLLILLTNILSIVILDIFIVQAILNIDIIMIVPIADGEDGGGGQRSPAVQHHLLPLLPGHHRLPGTASQQVPAQKSF